MANGAVLSFVANMPACAGRHRRIGVILALGWVLLGHRVAAAQEPDPDALRMQVEVAGGVHHVGQGIELRVGVVARGQRPELDPPAIAGADVWLIRNELKPLSVSGIGSMTVEANAFVSRFRVVPRRAGTLEVPSIRARLKDRTGRSRPVRADVRPVPPEGLTSVFPGRSGAVRASRPRRGPAPSGSARSWSIASRSPGRRRGARPAGPSWTGSTACRSACSIEPRPAEVVHEPPSRTFVYKLRPTRPGEAVLPPVSFSAFDPSTSRYVTRVTPSVPIKSVAVPSFDPATIPDLNAEARRGGPMGRDCGGGWSSAWASCCWARPPRSPGRGTGPQIRPARRPGRGAAATPPDCRGLGRPGSSDAKDLLPVSTWGPRAERPGPDAPGIRPRPGDQLGAHPLSADRARPPAGCPDARRGRRGHRAVHRVGRPRRQAARIAFRCDGVLYRDAPRRRKTPTSSGRPPGTCSLAWAGRRRVGLTGSHPGWREWR